MAYRTLPVPAKNRTQAPQFVTGHSNDGHIQINNANEMRVTDKKNKKTKKPAITRIA
jgi:hypothetical protein